jgi:hypothetical protein
MAAWQWLTWVRPREGRNSCRSRRRLRFEPQGMGPQAGALGRVCVTDAVSTMSPRLSVDPCGLVWTAVKESEERNPL